MLRLILLSFPVLGRMLIFCLFFMLLSCRIVSLISMILFVLLVLLSGRCAHCPWLGLRSIFVRELLLLLLVLILFKVVLMLVIFSFIR